MMTLLCCNPQIREHKDKGIYLEDVSELSMTSPDMIYDALRIGTAARSVASTRMNKVCEHIFAYFHELDVSNACAFVGVLLSHAAVFLCDVLSRADCSTVGYLSFGPIKKLLCFFATSACARKTGAAARVERRRCERRTLLAGAAGELAGATRAASQAFERMHILC